MRYDFPLALIVIGWGSPSGEPATGDLVRRSGAVDLVRSVLRASDLVGELDEDRVVAILTHTSAPQAARAAERVAEALGPQEGDDQHALVWPRLAVSDLGGGRVGTDLLGRTLVALKQATAAGLGKAEPVIHVVTDSSELAIADSSAALGR